MRRRAVCAAGNPAPCFCPMAPLALYLPIRALQGSPCPQGELSAKLTEGMGQSPKRADGMLPLDRQTVLCYIVIRRAFLYGAFGIFAGGGGGRLFRLYRSPGFELTDNENGDEVEMAMTV